MEYEKDPPNLEMWADATMPGPGYRAILEAIHKRLRPSNYLEIGVFKGETLALVRPGTRAIGVDPEPRIDEPLPLGVSVYRTTSNIFFEAARPLERFGERVAMTFVDGLHLFEQALRDIVNAERVATPDGFILVHDVLPLAPVLAERERRTEFWTGDVWKVVPWLQQWRPELELRMIHARPSGLLLISGLVPGCGAVGEGGRQRARELLEEPYGHDWQGRLMAVPRLDNDPDTVVAFLEARRTGIGVAA